MTNKLSIGNFEFTIPEDSFTNETDFSYPWDTNHANVKVYILHDAGFVQAVVFAENEQEACDIAADNCMIDQFRITDDEIEDYTQYADNQPLDHVVLGKAGDWYDIESLGIIELPCSAFPVNCWTDSMIDGGIDDLSIILFEDQAERVKQAYSDMKDLVAERIRRLE